MICFCVTPFCLCTDAVRRSMVNGKMVPDTNTGCSYMHLLANGAIQVTLVREIYQVGCSFEYAGGVC